MKYIRFDYPIGIQFNNGKIVQSHFPLFLFSAQLTKQCCS